MAILSVLSVILLLKTCQGANILALTPTPSYSHQVAFIELWKELSLRGHHVTLATTDPRNDPTLKNLREINMKSSYDIWTEKYSFSEQAHKGLGLFNIWEFFLYLLSDVMEYDLGLPELQELIHDHEKHHFDVVMIEVFYPELLAFGRIYNCPTIMMGTIGSTIQMYQYLGNPVHPALNPDMNVPFAGKLNFKERLVSTLFHWHQMFFEYFTFLPRKQQVLDKFFSNVTNASIEDLIKDIDMLIVNESPFLKGVRSLGPTTITVGGGNHLKPLKPLPAELQEYLDDAKEGFIYLSLGGNVKSKDLNNQTMTNIIEAFREIPYKVLWKFEAENLPNKPANVKLISWAPQQDILRHPNIKVFVTQGGILSLEEAIFTHVPMVVMPFYGDQLRNARIIEEKEIGKFVNHKPLMEKEDFVQAILEVAKNKKYKNTITRLAGLMQDQPMSGLDSAVWWTEYVIRNKGAKQLRNPASDIPFWQYYLLDVIGFFLIVAFIMLRITLTITRKSQQLISTLLGRLNCAKTDKLKSQ